MRLSGCLPAFCFIIAVRAAWAQHCLVIEDDGKPALVMAMRDGDPVIIADGKEKPVRTNRYALIDRGQYLPMYVAVRNVRVATSGLQTSTGDIVNRGFNLYCEMETNYALDNVILVIAVRTGLGEKGIFVREVGELKPRRTFTVNLVVPMEMPSGGGGHYQLYLFSNGRELFQTKMPIGAMESALNKMVRERIKDVRDSAPQPFIGPPPEYPKSLLKKKVGGQATLSVAIDMHGAVSAPTVVEASRSEFGEAAMAVIKEWRFLPKVKNGRPVPTTARMPFVFTPPDKT